jgi:hypothetical protein
MLNAIIDIDGCFDDYFAFSIFAISPPMPFCRFFAFIALPIRCCRRHSFRRWRQPALTLLFSCRDFPCRRYASDAADFSPALMSLQRCHAAASDARLPPFRPPDQCWRSCRFTSRHASLMSIATAPPLIRRRCHADDISPSRRRLFHYA